MKKTTHSLTHQPKIEGSSEFKHITEASSEFKNDKGYLKFFEKDKKCQRKKKKKNIECTN
jgi:hypothetical protein